MIGRGTWTRGLAVALLAGGAWLAGCSDDDGAEEEPCERTADCDDGEVCSDDGLCVEEEVPEIVEDEEYWLSYFARATQDVSEDAYRLQGSLDGDASDFDTGDVDCTQTRFCGFTKGGDYFVYATQNSEGIDPYYYDVVATPVSGDPPALIGESEVIVSDVAVPQITSEGVAYERNIDDRSTLFTKAIGGEEEFLHRLHAVDTPRHHWEFDADRERLMVWQPVGLDSMDMYSGRVDFEAPEEDRFENHLVTILDGTNRGQAGGLFQGGGPMAISPTGRYIAFVTGGPNDYEACSETGSSDECEGTARVCGEADEPRCVAVENTVHVVDMEYADDINEPCTSHDDCGPFNRCDSAHDDFSGGVCAGERFVLGVPPLSQGGKTGCEWTREDGSFGFTHINGPVSFSADNRIYVVGQRQCDSDPQDPETEVESNIDRSSIVAIDLETKTHEEVFGNTENADYAPGGCGLLPDVPCEEVGDCPEVEGNYDYACVDDICRQVPSDAQGDEYCVDESDCPFSFAQSCEDGVCVRNECVMVVDSAQTSPQGSDVLFTGTNPETASPGNAGRRLDMWRMSLVDGVVERLGNLESTTNVEFFQTFAEMEDEDEE